MSRTVLGRIAEEQERRRRNALSERVFLAAITGLLNGPNCPLISGGIIDKTSVIRTAADIAWSAPEYLEHGKF